MPTGWERPQGRGGLRRVGRVGKFPLADGDGAAGAPVRAFGGAGQQVLVHQVAAQRRVVVVDGLEDLVDRELGVAAARLEGLRHQVEEEQAGRALGGDDGNPAVPDVGTELAGQVAVEVHQGDYV